VSNTSPLELITPEVAPDEPTAPETVEDDLSSDQDPVATEPAAEEKKDEPDVLEVLEPSVEPVEVTLVHAGHERVYIQGPLSYFRKMEFFGLVGKTIDHAMEGEDGLTVNSLFGSTPTSVGDLSMGDFADLDSFMSLVAKIAAYSEDFLKQCYLVWLNVPKTERSWAREALDSLSDDDGEEIIARFVDQNWEALERFFTERLPRLGKRVAARRKKD
jgi:hypothetical protein